MSIALCGVALLFWLRHDDIFPLAQRRKLLRIYYGVLIVVMGLTAALYVGRLPRGLSGEYYDNPAWAGDPVIPKVLFDPGDRHVDRRIDFITEDFKRLARKPLSVIWQGYVNLPEECSLDMLSNFGAWLRLDDMLVAGASRIDFGMPAARPQLGAGWSYDETWGANPELTFLWSSGRQSEFFLGVETLADYTFSIRCAPFVYAENPPQHLTVAINGFEVDTLVLTPEWKTYTISVPRGVIEDTAPGFALVTLTYSHVVRPSEVLTGSQEHRRLAVAFDAASLQPAAQGSQLDRVLESSEPRTFSAGLHRIALKAFHPTGTDPFIQLVWQPIASQQQEVIPEDFLFPQDVPLDHIRQRIKVERIALGGIIFVKGLLLLVLGSLLLGVFLRRLVVMAFNSPGKLVIVACSILCCGLLIHLRYVCDKPQQLRTFLLVSYCFFFSAPCFYLVFKVIFPKLLSTFFFTLFLLLALFPYKVLFPATTSLCAHFSEPATTALIAGLDTYWALILYALIALVITGWWWRYFHKKRLRHLMTREVLFCGAIALIVAAQILPRLDERSPRMVSKGIHEHPERCGTGNNSYIFFEHCVMADSPHYTDSNGLFKGVDDQAKYDKLWLNRRSLTAYLYSLIEPLLHPYYAAILMNGAFFYCILVAGYTFVKHLRLPQPIRLIYPLVLSASLLLLLQTIDATFYIQTYFFQFLILVIGYKIGLYSRSISFVTRFLFCMVLACTSLVYDPYVIIAFIFLWGCFHSLSLLRSDTTRARLTAFYAILYAVIPIISGYGFEALLKYYHLEGNLLGNVEVKNEVLRKIPSLLGYLFLNLKEAFLLVNKEMVQLVIINPIITEYFYLLGAFGVICFFSLVPKRLKHCDLKGIYTMYSSVILVPLTAAFLSRIPPEGVYAFAYTFFSRSTTNYPVLAFAQSLGIYVLAEGVCRWLPTWIKPAYIAYAVVLVLFICSYYLTPTEAQLFSTLH